MFVNIFVAHNTPRSPGRTAVTVLVSLLMAVLIGLAFGVMMAPWASAAGKGVGLGSPVQPVLDTAGAPGGDGALGIS